MKMLAAEKNSPENNDFEATEKALHECLIKKQRENLVADLAFLKTAADVKGRG